MCRRGNAFTKRIFQELRHGLQDFPRKLIIRYRASYAEGAYERAIAQDRLRSCAALIGRASMPPVRRRGVAYDKSPVRNV
jgi:hypothetical protein